MKQIMPVLSVRKIANDDQPFGHEKGKEVFLSMLDQVTSSPDEDIFCISLEGIKATDSSFPRESAIALAKHFRGERGFFLEGLSSRDLIDNWNYPAEIKQQPLVIWNGDDFKFIGPQVGRANELILNYLYIHGIATASEISTELDMSIQNASTKLKNLYKQGYALRTEETADTGGKEFIYRAIGPNGKEESSNF